MNEYRISYTSPDGTSESIQVIERSEQTARVTARRRLKELYPGASQSKDTITDIELADVNIPATKQQERDALATIRKIVEELGPQSYVGTAFEGCFKDAEDNIENDFGCSMKQRLESAEFSEDQLREKLTAAESQLKAAQERLNEFALLVDDLKEERSTLERKSAEQIAAIRRRQITEELRRDLWTMTTSEAEASRARMAKAADRMAVCADNPACVGFKESLAEYRKEKQRAEEMERRAAELDAMEPEQ